jgi:hypothetical protein
VAPLVFVGYSAAPLVFGGYSAVPLVYGGYSVVPLVFGACYSVQRVYLAGPVESWRRRRCDCDCGGSVAGRFVRFGGFDWVFLGECARRGEEGVRLERGVDGWLVVVPLVMANSGSKSYLGGCC